MCVFAITGNGSDAVYVTKTLPHDAWVHVAGVYDPDDESMKLYVNGVLVDDTPSGTVPTSIYSSDSDVWLGRCGGAHLDGHIDDVRIYARALPAREVKTLAGGNNAYDGLNRRVVHADRDYYYNTSWPVASGSAGGVEWQALEVRKGQDADPLKQYVWDLRYIDAPVARWYDSDQNGTVNQIWYYTTDANMNVTAMVAYSNGVVQERYAYAPYGAVTVLDADWSADADNASDVDNRILYCGYRLDTATGAVGQGLYHVRNRHYLPPLGRWPRRDPLNQDAPAGGYHDGMGLYVYARSAPAVVVDPKGLIGADCRYTGNGYVSKETRTSRIIKHPPSSGDKWLPDLIKAFGSIVRYNMDYYQCQCTVKCKDYDYVCIAGGVQVRHDPLWGTKLSVTPLRFGWRRDPADDETKPVPVGTGWMVHTSYDDFVKSTDAEATLLGHLTLKVWSASTFGRLGDEADAAKVLREFVELEMEEGLVDMYRAVLKDVRKKQGLSRKEQFDASVKLKRKDYELECDERCRKKKGQKE